MRATVLPIWTRRIVATMVEFFATGNQRVRRRWVRRPDLRPGDEVCLFVTFAPGVHLARYSVFHARAWAEAGFRVVLIVISDTPAADLAYDDLGFAAGLLVRENRGYDFGAWASAVEDLPEVRDASLLALVNDSLYGPLDTFGDMLRRVRALDADFIGSTESKEVVRHFQSFLLFFKATALKSDAFGRFWRRVRAGGRLLAIYRYECGLLAAMERGGLRCATLFGRDYVENPTLVHWRELIEKGFPYVKVATLRDNPFEVDLSDWPELLRAKGYDPELARRHLAQSSPNRSRL